ncbi:MAG: hypothetical protein ACT4OE_04645 [Sphingosinicella sp.]
MASILPRAGLACALLAAIGTGTPARAQTAPPPRFQAVDANGVDLVSGRFVLRLNEGSIGTGDGEVSILRGQRG